MTAPDSTRDRIVTAAKAEFARYGVAGARIERIAKAAKTSKERLYAYFRSKEALYHFVAGQELTAAAEATRMDPADLPGYAGRLHDYWAAHPERYRLMSWGRLEFDTLDETTRAVMARKLGQLREAQAAGLVDAVWDAMDVMMFVNQIATTWAGQVVPESERDARRAAVVEAVGRLFPAGGGG